MTIRIGEVGKEIFVGTDFDLSANTEIAINFSFANANISFQRDSSDGVTAPAVPSPDLPNVGILAANTYLLYVTKAADFTAPGIWCLSSQYEDATPVLFIGDSADLTVSDIC